MSDGLSAFKAEGAKQASEARVASFTRCCLNVLRAAMFSADSVLCPCYWRIDYRRRMVAGGHLATLREVSMTFPVGYHSLHPDVSLNFQMNRLFGCVGELEML